MFIVDSDIILDSFVFSPVLVVSTSATDCLERLVSEMTNSILYRVGHLTLLLLLFN